MPGMRSEEEILKAFEGLDTVPGSRHARVDSSTEADRKRAKAFGETNGWDENPIMKPLNGVVTEMFTISALAQALEKTIVTIRLWESKGYIPAAPYRLRSKELNGQKVKGNRVYTRELIEIAIEEFDKRKLIGAKRVLWSSHRSLTYTLVERWKEAVQARKMRNDADIER